MLVSVKGDLWNVYRVNLKAMYAGPDEHSDYGNQDYVMSLLSSFYIENFCNWNGWFIPNQWKYRAPHFLPCVIHSSSENPVCFTSWTITELWVLGVLFEGSKGERCEFFALMTSLPLSLLHYPLLVCCFGNLSPLSSCTFTRAGLMS